MRLACVSVKFRLARPHKHNFNAHARTGVSYVVDLSVRCTFCVVCLGSSVHVSGCVFVGTWVVASHAHGRVRNHEHEHT